jgi:ribonuclease HII
MARPLVEAVLLARPLRHGHLLARADLERGERQTHITGRYERHSRRQGFRLIAGVDEVGRGCLFGPVFAAAVILDPARPIRGLDDSKALSPERRTILASRIRERSLCWAVSAVDAYWIDRINILEASRWAMRRAIQTLAEQPDFVYVDALKLDISQPQRALIHGDARCASIAAASIVAKVERDSCLAKWHDVYPEYGLANNKGYCAPEHFEGLNRCGPVCQHRFSFAPVRAAAGLGQAALF